MVKQQNVFHLGGIIPAQKSEIISRIISPLAHLPESAIFLGGLSLLVLIEEKSPGDCVDG
jgi:hypothetical protein